MQFYPEKTSVTLDPLQGNGELYYVLMSSTDIPVDYISQRDITFKYAFSGTWKVNSHALKIRIRDILVSILDIGRFSIKTEAKKIYICVPLKPLRNISLLPQQGIVEVPVVAKVYKKHTANTQGFQLKCRQTICIETGSPASEESLEIQEEYIELPAARAPTKFPTQETPQTTEQKVSQPKEEAPEVTEEDASPISDLYADIEAEITTQQENESDSGDYAKRLFNGLVAIDFGTTNSVIVVRDPHYAAEEIRESLSRDQWHALEKWCESWIIHHLSVLKPSATDLAVEELIRYIPQMELPPCGSLSMEIWEELQQIDGNAKAAMIEETIEYLSMFDTEQYPSTVLQDLSCELLSSFERVIYSQTLESQRYFVLELDKNAGPGPIASALQIVSAPCTSEIEKLEEETEIEMGVRVSLLMRSAVIREADIRQFALTIKRYFGQGDSIELVPSETASTPLSFPVDSLCRLAYKKLLDRALDDIKRHAQMGEFEYADWVYNIVATFPTTYPASLRRKLRDLLNELEVVDIDTRFDEGTASALYYIWREVCSDPVCSMHGLMARCRQDRHQRAYQNILLYDLGGGTTDIALIQLIYEELPIFEPIDKGKYENGRYFRITPRLLGATGHRYIGGDLITLWLFRLVKSKVVDKILSLLVNKKIDTPGNDVFSHILANLPQPLLTTEGYYQSGSLLEWSFFPAQNLREYENLNHTILNLVIPTTFEEDHSFTPNYFILWKLTEEAKESLGTPVATYSGTGLGQEWQDFVTLDHHQLWKLLVSIHSHLEDCGIQAEEMEITISQKELCNFARDPIVESLSLAVNLAKARLRAHDVIDKLDRFILSGFSCNLQAVQEEARNIFRKHDDLFDFNLANVCFEQEVAKTSVAMGACIGRYLESVRLDPYDEKTRQMLREGYDQVELVVENLFTYLACRLVYDSLVAMVTTFDHGQPLNKRSYIDGKPVARTMMNALRPVQEKFWIYRVDFEEANPLYLGLINAEATAYKNDFEDFRKFREQYLVGFEVDAEIFIRAFFLPRGPKNILADNFLEDDNNSHAAKAVVEMDKDGFPVLTHTISSQELFNRRPVLTAGTKLQNTIEYADGSKHFCAISNPLPAREMYDFYIEGMQKGNEDPSLVAHFQIADEEIEEIALVCDATGRLVLLLAIVYDIKIWADIDYVPQKIDAQYDPFCGQH